MPAASEVVITGIGIVSPIGIGREAVEEALVAGRSGIGPLPDLAGSDYPVRIGGLVEQFEPKQYVRPRKALKVMSREIQMGYAAAMLARDDAGLDVEQLDPDRFGVVYGADMFYCPPEELLPVFRRASPEGVFDFRHFGTAAMKELFPLWMLLYLPNMAACHIGIALDGRGPNNTISLGEVSALLAIAEAVRVIERDGAETMIAGGLGNRLSPTPMAYRGVTLLSKRNDDPQRASRPFEKERDGMVHAEGAAAIVLERRSAARRRGAAILAEVLGMASSFGRESGRLGPSREAIIESIEGTLAAAECPPEQVGGIVAHGVGTVEHDRVEAQAIAAVFGDRCPVTALKSYYGNSGAACGAMDLVAALVGLQQGTLPPTRNYDQPDPECPVAVVSPSARPLLHPNLLVLSQSATGQAAGLLLRLPETHDTK